MNSFGIGGVFYVGSKMNSFRIWWGMKNELLCWIKNELIWNLGLIWNLERGGVFYVGSKMNSFGIGGVFYVGWMKNELIWNLGGVFYVGSKMNSFGIWEAGYFTLDEK